MNIGRDYFFIKGKNAESLVHDLALRTFLTDWCYLNPHLPDGRELCDLLVIFDDIAIIWQIKDLKLNKHGKYKKSEVKKNLRQLAGARRQLFDLQTAIELQNPRRGKEAFNPTIIKEIYLISVLLGAGEDIFSPVENIKNYTTHVFTKNFTQIILNELDTITDFIGYIRAKENLFTQNIQIIIKGGEEELLALYLGYNRTFKKFYEATMLTIEDGSWEHLQDKPAYKAKKKEDEISYIWDSLINECHKGSPSSSYEAIARELARPNRFERRVLSKHYFDAFIKADRDDTYNIFRRTCISKGVTYCFLFQDDSVPRDNRKAMLANMCFIARGKYQENRKVLGIATEKKYESGFSYDFCLVDIPEWTQENQRAMEELQKGTGILDDPIVQYTYETEYPEKQLK